MAELDMSGNPLIFASTDLEELENNHEFLTWLRKLDGEMERRVLIWTYDGAAPAEIAAELRMNPATVRAHLRNARAKLRRIRDADGGPDE